MISQILHLIQAIDFYRLGLLERFVAEIFHLGFRSMLNLSQFLLCIFLLLLFDRVWS
jgi:hypothetical protein